MKDESKPYWFRAKRYGWGWGLPLRWQGWLVLVAYLALQLGACKLLVPADMHSFAGVTIALALILVLICWRTGEPPR